MNLDFKKRLEGVVGKGSVRTEMKELRVYERQMGQVPDAVVDVTDSRQASRVVKLANRFRIPFVPADSGGVCTRGGRVMKRGFVLNFASMNRMKENRVLDLLCVVEPGVTLGDLDSALRPYRFFFPPDPGGSGMQSLGRVVIDNASFPGGLKYGTPRDYVLGVEAVMATGEVVTLGSTTLKNSSGLQIEKFFSGTGWMIGFPTEITVAVRPLPEKRALCIACFDSHRKALDAVALVFGSNVAPTSVEMMNSAWTKMCAVPEIAPDAATLLLVESDGHPRAVKRVSDAISRICRNAGAASVNRTSDARKIEKWKTARKPIDDLTPENGTLAMRIIAPFSEVAETLDNIGKIGRKHSLTAGFWGFFQEGCLHMVLTAGGDKRKSPEEALTEVRKIASSGGFADYSLIIGYSPTDTPALGESVLDRVSSAIKTALDPNGIIGLERGSRKKAVQS